MIRDEFDLIVNGYSLRACFLKHVSVPASFPTIIFLHDSLGCITLWRDFPERLAKATGCNALVYDRQGYGQSAPFSTPRTIHYLEDEAHILVSVLEKCEIKSAVLFGHSDGGSISLVAAAEYPDRVRCVISEAAHVFVDRLTIEGIERTRELYRTTNLKERIARYHGDKTESVFAAWTETWLADWYQHWNIEKYLARIQCPVMAIQGERDEFGTQAQLFSIASQVGGVSYPCLLPKIGHTPHREAAEEIERITSEFIGKFLPPRRASSAKNKPGA